MIAVGVVLLVFGIIASNSINSEVSRILTGTSTSKLIAMLAGGSAFAIAGMAGLFRGTKGR